MFGSEPYERAPILNAIRELPAVDDLGDAGPAGPACDPEALTAFLEWADPLRPPPMSPGDSRSEYSRWLRVQLGRARARIAGIADQLAKMTRERDNAYSRVADLTMVSDHQPHTRDECNDLDCAICAGDLASCTVCGGAEAAMPVQCPGEKMTGDQMDEVQAGTLDFVRGKWMRAVETDKKKGK